MTAAAEIEAAAARPDPIAIFIARAQARAILWACGELDLHAAVDQLQADAERSGLIAELGQDGVQRLLADAFAPHCDVLASSEDQNEEISAAEPVAGDDTFAAVCRAADEKQWRQPRDERLDRLRALLADDVGLDRAWRELNTRAPGDVPTATLEAAEYLMREKDPARMRAWLAQHTAPERAAILQHLERRKGTRAK